MQEQLSLPVNLPDDQTLQSFIVAENASMWAHLQKVLKDGAEVSQLTFIGGEAGSGKSHLLYGLCHHCADQEKQAAYLDFSLLHQLNQDLLLGLENFDLVCLDNIHYLAKDDSWQTAVFDLINRCLEQGKAHMVVTANCGPAQLGFNLADLNSRLVWGTSFFLTSLDDSGLQAMLIKRAQLRGMSMNEEVAQFILSRYNRHSEKLMELLSQLDRLSLQQQKKLSIPFVKKVLAL